MGSIEGPVTNFRRVEAWWPRVRRMREVRRVVRRVGWVRGGLGWELGWDFVEMLGWEGLGVRSRIFGW